MGDRKSRQKWKKEVPLDNWNKARKIAKKLLGEGERSYIAEDVDKAIRERYGILL